MKSNIAKVLHRLDGRPLINHVCETARSLGPAATFVVVGHQAGDVETAVRSESGSARVEFPVQKQQLGTGDAVNSARALLEDRESTLLVLSGDVPMITEGTLRALVAAHAGEPGGAA